MLYLFGQHNLSEYYHEQVVLLTDQHDIVKLNYGYLLYVAVPVKMIPHLDSLIEMLKNDPKCLFITNHFNWSQGWALIQLSRSGRNYQYYLKINQQFELQRKKLHWFVIKPINGLANRIRFMISSLAVGHYFKYRCFLSWMPSHGFDDTKFESLFDLQFLKQYNLTLINSVQFDILNKNAFKIDEHIPGILNGLGNNNYNNGFNCLIEIKHLQQNPVMSITGSNSLVYIFEYFPQFQTIKEYIVNKFTQILTQLKPNSSIMDTLTQIDSVNTYGLHIRRGETYNFDLSRIGYFLNLIQTILYYEPLAKFFIATNDQYTLEFLKEQLPNKSIIHQPKQFLEKIDWNHSYLNNARPNGSSIESLRDLWSLSHCKKIFGSNESSFSLMASMWQSKPYFIIRSSLLDEIHNYFYSGWSLVTCCMNRSQNLLINLTSWLNCPYIDEIVIIDWSSKQPLLDKIIEAGIDNSKIRCYRVENQTSWILTWAYNLAIMLTRFDKIIKVDCDIYLSPKFLASNNNFELLSNQHFYTGDWHKSNQIHLNGQLVINKIDFLSVNGYNEFLTCYGYDDTDLYERLESLGFTKSKLIDTQDGDILIYHIDHTNLDRTCHQQVKHKLTDLIENNHQLCQKLPWNIKMERHRYLINQNQIYII